MSELSKALAEFQKSLPQIKKNQRANTGTYGYTYADLAEVNGTVLPALGKCGLSFTCCPTMLADDQFVLAYELRHLSGESICGIFPLPRAGKMQDIGGAITYARRYALLSLSGVAPDEDDNDAATAPEIEHHPVRRAAEERVQSAVTRPVAMLRDQLKEMGITEDEEALKVLREILDLPELERPGQLSPAQASRALMVLRARKAKEGEKDGS